MVVLIIPTVLLTAALANAAALPQSHSQAPLLSARSADDKPVAKLPTSVLASMQVEGGKHVPGDHHRDGKKKGKGKGKKGHKRRMAMAYNDVVHAEILDGYDNGYDEHDGTLIHIKRDHDHHHHHHHHGRDEHIHEHIHKHGHHHGKRMENLKLRGQNVYERDHDDHDDDHDHDDGHDHDHEHKRALINLGHYHQTNAPTYYSPNGELLHLEIGKRFLGQARGPIDGSMESFASLLGRSVKARDHDHDHDHHHHHNHRRTEGVEGVIHIVSMTAGSAPTTIASLLLSNDPNNANAFELNASNSNATNVYMVPANTTSASSTDGSIPVSLKVPVYAPEHASMEDFCMSYDPNPPAPAPLAAAPCTDTMTEHLSQIFSYTPSSGVIVPMWSVTPASVDPSAASDGSNDAPDASSSDDSGDDSTTTTVSASTTATATATDSSTMTATPTDSTTDSATTTSASASATTSTAAQEKRSVASYLVQAVDPPSSDPTCDDNAQSMDAASTSSNDTASAAAASAPPTDVILVFVPSDAAAILPSSFDDPSAATFYPAPGESNDGNVGGAPSTSSFDGSSNSNSTSTSPGSTDDSTVDNSADAPTVASTDPNGSVNDAVNGEEMTSDGQTATSQSSPTMTPVADAMAPYSLMFAQN